MVSLTLVGVMGKIHESTSSCQLVGTWFMLKVAMLHCCTVKLLDYYNITQLH